MNDEQFKIGDVVRLKSGGPGMTVTAVGETYEGSGLSVWVSWFDDKMKSNSGTFPIQAVERS